MRLLPLHGIGSRQDLPLPFWLVLVGAAVTLIVTFWLLRSAWTQPRYSDIGGVELPRLTRIVDSRLWRATWRALTLILVSLGVLGLVAGPDRLDNPIFGMLFVWVWVGVVPASLLLGRVWRMVNPIRSLLAVAQVPQGSPATSIYPGAAALAVFSFVELVQPGRATLPVLRTWIAIWLIWLLVGALMKGRCWIGAADPFEVYATTLARFSPWGRSAGQKVVFTNPLRQLASWRPPNGLALAAVVLLGGTAFDSMSNSVWWLSLSQRLPADRTLIGALGLVLMLLLVGALYLCGTALVGRSKQPRWRVADTYAPGLIPIVAGYALAHYGTLLWLEGQRTAIAISDPLGVGWNLFGTAELGVNTAILNYPMVISILQVLLIVGGHVCGVIVTHDIALQEEIKSPREAHSQVGLLITMVCFTIGGLLLLFA